MKTFKDFKNDIRECNNIKKHVSIKKYRAFMDYMSKIISIMLKDSEQEIISWLNDEDNNDSLILSTYIETAHYIRIRIGLSDDKSHMNIISFESVFTSYDYYCDSKIDFNSTDKSVIKFFEREYDNFFKQYTPCSFIMQECLVNKFVNKFNDAFYEKFRPLFESINMDIYNFKRSEYALSFSDEKLSEISKQISAHYDVFAKIGDEFDSDESDSIKELYYTNSVLFYVRKNDTTELFMKTLMNILGTKYENYSEGCTDYYKFRVTRPNYSTISVGATKKLMFDDIYKTPEQYADDIKRFVDNIGD